MDYEELIINEKELREENMDKAVSEYMSKIGKKGGENGKRTWSEEEKRAMVAKKAETLQKKAIEKLKKIGCDVFFAEGHEVQIYRIEDDLIMTSKVFVDCNDTREVTKFINSYLKEVAK
jgi:hypothetical protein